MTRENQSPGCREQRLALRPPARADAEVIAAIFTASRRDAMPYLPLLYTDPREGLLTRREATRKLRCSPKTLDAHVAAGSSRYVQIGHGR
jgi:hypothetical protein